MDDELTNGLDLLGYSAKWVEYAFLDSEMLRRQLMVFETGEDRDTEHYRYSTFCHVLDRDGLSDIDLDRYLELVDHEVSEETASSVLFLVIHWPKLSAGQRARLRRQPMFSEGRLQRQFAIYDLSVELSGDKISDDLYERCLATGDETLQRKIVEHRGVTLAQVGQLALFGKSKSVRNMGAARLRRMESMQA
jgi:hypothetical protein